MKKPNALRFAVASASATRPSGLGRGLAAACVALIGWSAPAAAQTSDLVNRATLRVCADPADLPLSNEKGEGYENKIAEMLAKDLGVPLDYTWFPQATGFYRMTLGIKRCDVVMGYVAAGDPVLNTNPYFRSTWVLISKKGGPLEGVDTLSDPKLKDGRIGVIAGTPPASHLVRNGLMGRAKPYALMVDRRYDSPAEEMLRDIDSGEVAGGILWGPIGGYFAGLSADKYSVVPLLKEPNTPSLLYRITFGVRPDENNWKHRLNEFIKKNQAEINKILASYHVPLVNEQDKVIEVTQ
jgi:quinoprotein dehydrogenase-associated probable ABC transporter substrate-binding protein